MPPLKLLWMRLWRTKTAPQSKKKKGGAAEDAVYHGDLGQTDVELRRDSGDLVAVGAGLRRNDWCDILYFVRDVDIQILGGKYELLLGGGV